MKVTSGLFWTMYLPEIEEMGAEQMSEEKLVYKTDEEQLDYLTKEVFRHETICLSILDFLPQMIANSNYSEREAHEKIQIIEKVNRRKDLAKEFFEKLQNLYIQRNQLSHKLLEADRRGAN